MNLPNIQTPRERRIRLFRYLLAISLLVNLGVAFGVVNVIRGRGGITYLKAYFLKDATANIDLSAVNREGIFRVLPSPGPGAIVFLGDSLTSNCEWNELFGTGLKILNRGIGGDTSAGVLSRLSTVSDLRPLAVFLMIGTNDPQLLGYAPADTLRNDRLIIQKLMQSSPDTRIYLESILPTRAPKFNKWREEVNRGLRQLPNEAPKDSVTFVELESAFLDSNQLLDERYTFDGIHLNANGYLLWKQQLYPLIQELTRGDAVRKSQN